jgi:hypothetical protein
MSKRKPKSLYLTLADVPAFPLDPGTGADDPYNGLTKREYFAAMALRQGVDAATAIALADHMIEALNAQAAPVATPEPDPNDPLE